MPVPVFWKSVLSEIFNEAVGCFFDVERARVTGGFLLIENV